MTVSKFTTAPKNEELAPKINEIIDNLGGGGTATDVQINGTSITSNNVANIITNSAYNSSSNKIATMSDIPEEIFIATYGTTTFSDILTAYNSGKSIFCKYNYSATNVFYLYLSEVGKDSSNNIIGFVFDGTNNGIEYMATRGSTENWNITDRPIETIYNKVTSISSSSTNTQYPSAKCVYDEINTVKRNIGEIVTSTIPLTDAGLHLLDGSLLAYATYKDFIDYIADLYDSGDYPDLFETEANWQSAVTTYGVCGKFVYNSTNNTVRLPKITGIIEGTTDLTALGDLVEAGLPNITGSLTQNTYYKTGTGSGALSYTQTNTRQSSSGSDMYLGRIDFDASNSNSIYGNSSTVQPQTIKVLYYIVIANTTKTQIEVDIDEIATDLNGKADTDLSNVPTSKGILQESYVNGTSGYRIYSDGCCEQWGVASVSNGNTGLQVALSKSYANSDYVVLVNNRGSSYSTTGVCADVLSGSAIKIYYNTTASRTIQWYTLGYIR